MFHHRLRARREQVPPIACGKSDGYPGMAEHDVAEARWEPFHSGRRRGVREQAANELHLSRQLLDIVLQEVVFGRVLEQHAGGQEHAG